MKKLICVCLMALLLVGLTVAVSAKGNEKVTIVAAEDADPGEAVAFIVSVSGSDLVYDCEVTPVFDEDVFTLVSASWIVKADETAVNEKTGAPIAIWEEPTAIDGELCTIVLRVKEDVAPGVVTEVSCSVNVTDENVDPIRFSNVSTAKITMGCEHEFVEQVDEEFLKEPSSCTAPAVYYVSCSICGQMGTETFTDGDAVGHDFTQMLESEEYLDVPGDCKTPAKYFISCSVCGQKSKDVFESVSGAAHVFDAQIEEEKYLKEEGTCTDPAVYYISCSVCGEKGTETFQSEKEGGHVFDAKKEYKKYLAKEGDCTEPAEYYFSCSVCGEKGEKTFESEKEPKHDFTGKEETEEHLSDPGDCQNKRQYYYICTVCGAQSEETFVSEKKFGVHEYDNDCDTDCNVCGKYQEPKHEVGEEWSADEEGHWHVCTRCEAEVERAEHVPGPEATVDEPQVCTVCQFVLNVSDEHTHEYSSDWASDEKSHWHECSCGSKGDLSVHSWTLVDTDRTDVLVAQCDVCGATKEEPVASIPEETTKPTKPTEPEPTEKPQTPEESKGLNVPAIVLGILLAASLAGNGVLAWMLFGKKKK